MIWVELALEMSKLVHNECKDVPHDIGLKLLDIVKNHIHSQSVILQINDVNYTSNDVVVKCGDCGKIMTEVRPGKYQCELCG